MICKIKISWLTGSNFLDVDMPLLPILSKKFCIKWIVIKQKNSWYTEKEIQNFIYQNSIDGCVLTMSGRLRSVNSFNIYKKAVQIMKSHNPDIFYINYIGVPYLWPIISISNIDKNKVIYPCHDYVDHKGVKNRLCYVWTKKLIFHRYNHFQFFSQTQKELFTLDYKKGKDSFFAPLALKGFGKPSKMKQSDKIVKFLFFGNIRENKGIEYLISAANSLYEKYAEQFVVMIYGYCKNWEKYQALIKHPECFDLQIRRIENYEIADLFNNADYLMLPYRDVTQSGPLLIAYYYCLPVIASNHQGFREYVDDGKTGFIHKNEDSSNLCNVMIKAIKLHNTYQLMKDNLATFIKNNVSLPHIVSLYEQGFYNVLKSQGQGVDNE